ncbi:hypothetical protein Patl_0685 [Paraglaciecola sp. T6c]|uniref:hypothetical protein n=1 Tax=Pseudoalteromonas atlantica (strain T6c / ATCC BAA-1087) TaxID=3042615 RepID=UPI00005C6BC2|nr:hypothetical protein [Paraglaciecola sp. T6c]ABG39213.1 hypothetical protein Patl_0685 [Paraglaciecola sp. T6c]
MNNQTLEQLKAENAQLAKSVNHLLNQNISAENLLNELLLHTNPSAIDCETLVAKIHMLHMHWHRTCHDLKHGQGPSMAGVPTKVIMMKGRKHGLSHMVAADMASGQDQSAFCTAGINDEDASTVLSYFSQRKRAEGYNGPTAICVSRLAEIHLDEAKNVANEALNAIASKAKQQGQG